MEFGKLLFAIVATFFVFFMVAMIFWVTNSGGFYDSISGFQIFISAVIALIFFGLFTRNEK